MKASNNCINNNQYKLPDFVPEFAELRQSEDNTRFGCDNISNNLLEHSGRENLF